MGFARSTALLGIAAAAGSCLLAATPRGASAGSLPAPATGHRPGPDILYAPLAQAPQLSNTGVWTAPPILVSGTSAYRGGEYLYQDFLYDDHGANGQVSDPTDPRRSPGGNGASGDLFSMPAGTYTYPTDRRYAQNAADLVELRVRPLATATAFRITLNTLTDASLYAVTLAIGSAAAPRPVPHGANATDAARFFVTVHGGTALVDGIAAPQPVGVTVDTARRQVVVLVPHADWTPSGVVRLSAGVGLWDNLHGKYLLPGFAATATAPGGAGTLTAPTAFYNVAFRHDEALPSASHPIHSATTPAWWRDAGQAAALRSGDLGHYHDDIDFARLAAGANDDMNGLPQGVPLTGPMDRILASHFETEQGIDDSTACASATACQGEYRGQLQPYAIYVPRAHGPSGYGMTLLLHSLSANYNQYLGSHNQSQFGNRAPGSIVITPEGRGPDGWYFDVAGADTFEVWADVAARYTLDPDLSVIAGYSMGGYGTYKLATEFPDLFSRAQPTVGPPALGIWVPPAAPTGGASTNTNSMLGSMRNVPVLIWVMATDELVPIAGTTTQALTFDGLNYRYQFNVFTPGEHLTLAINDQYAPAAAFLGNVRVDRNPAHVTYVVNPSMDFAADAFVADHAYWLSGLQVRDRAAGGGEGTIDVRSEGFGVGDPAVSATRRSGGALTGGTVPAIAFASSSKTWGPAPATPVADRLDIRATNLSTVVVDTTRARVDCGAALNVNTDGPLTVVLAGCNRTVVVAPASAAAGPRSHTAPAAAIGQAATAVVQGAALPAAALPVAMLGAAPRRRRRGR